MTRNTSARLRLIFGGRTFGVERRRQHPGRRRGGGHERARLLQRIRLLREHDAYRLRTADLPAPSADLGCSLVEEVSVPVCACQHERVERRHDVDALEHEQVDARV